MIYDIPKRLDNIIDIKNKFDKNFKSVGLNTNIPFRQYSDLIKEIPNTGAITSDEIDISTILAIDINGEKA